MRYDDYLDGLLAKYPEAFDQLDNYEPLEFERYKVEFDIIPAENKEDIEFWLLSKIRHEGEPDQEWVDEIGKSGKIEQPVILDTRKNYAVEGRHRLAAALKYDLDVPALLLYEG